MCCPARSKLGAPGPLRTGALLWLIALMFPFFGVINDVLGAFTSTFEVCCARCALCMLCPVSSAHTTHAALWGRSAMHYSQAPFGSVTGQCTPRLERASQRMSPVASLGSPTLSLVSLYALQTFIIPPLVYNIYYQLKKDASLSRAQSTKPPSKCVRAPQCAAAHCSAAQCSASCIRGADRWGRAHIHTKCCPAAAQALLLAAAVLHPTRYAAMQGPPAPGRLDVRLSGSRA